MKKRNCSIVLYTTFLLLCASCTGGHQHHSGQQPSEEVHGHRHHEEDHEEEDAHHPSHDEHESGLHEDVEHDGHLHHDSLGEHPDGEIIFTLEQAKEANLQVVEVVAGDFQQVIQASGKIISNSSDEFTIVSPTTGILTLSKSSMAEGKLLKKGEVIAHVSARNMAEGDVTDRQKLELESAKKEYERVSSLKESKLVTNREYEEAKLRYEQAKVAYSSVSQTVSEKGVSVTASTTGYLKNLSVQSGDFVSVGTPIAVITKNKKMQLRVDVPERYYHSIRTIKSANFKVSYDTTLYVLKKMGGRLLSYGRNAQENSGSITVSFEFDNDFGFMSGAYTEVFLLTSPKKNVISVPISSLCESQGIYFVYVQHGEDCFVRREVKLGQSNGESVEILSGLAQGEKVVVNGAIQIRLASNASAIPEHSHSH